MDGGRRTYHYLSRPSVQSSCAERVTWKGRMEHHSPTVTWGHGEGYGRDLLPSGGGLHVAIGAELLLLKDR
jgi:hypothetical protein